MRRTRWKEGGRDFVAEAGEAGVLSATQTTEADAVSTMSSSWSGIQRRDLYLPLHMMA